MNGLEATKEIRSRSDWKSRIPILSLTADATKGGEGRLRRGRRRCLHDKAFQSRLLDCGRQNPRSVRTCIASIHAGRQYIEAVATTLHLSGECAAAFNVWGKVL